MGHRIRFGIFLAPFHKPGINPTLALEQDLELISWLDRCGYDEAWCGEHHSAGSEISASPEILIGLPPFDIRCRPNDRCPKARTGAIDPSATSNDSYRSFVAAPGCRSMSAFKVQRSAVAKTAAGSYGSIALCQLIELLTYRFHRMPIRAARP